VSPITGLPPIATVWYRWDSNFSGTVDVSTCGSSVMDLASVHLGSTFATMSTVAPSAEAPPTPCASPDERGFSERFVAVAGATYRIQVAGYKEGIEGPFRLTIVDPDAVPPPSDGLQPSGGAGDQGPAATTPGTTKITHGLKDKIKQCRKRFKGKSKKVRKKRTNCIAKAKRQAALAKCQKIGDRSKRKQCVERARKPHAAPIRRRAPRARAPMPPMTGSSAQ
jgi:hypothetical protein